MMMMMAGIPSFEILTSFRSISPWLFFMSSTNFWVSRTKEPTHRFGVKLSPLPSRSKLRCGVDSLLALESSPNPPISFFLGVEVSGISDSSTTSVSVARRHLSLVSDSMVVVASLNRKQQSIPIPVPNPFLEIRGTIAVVAALSYSNVGKQFYGANWHPLYPRMFVRSKRLIEMIVLLICFVFSFVNFFCSLCWCFFNVFRGFCWAKQ